MPSSREVQERRREAIRAILAADEPIAEQRDLVELLKSKGIPATQSSVSRDLRDLGAVRIDGRYQILDWLQADETSSLRKARAVIVKIATVGPHQIVVVTQPGAGGFVGEAIEACGWEDVVATVAGYSSVLVLTANKFFQDFIWQLLNHYLGSEGEEKEKKEEGEQGSPKTEA